MLLTSRRIKGEEALAMGLADELVPLADVGTQHTARCRNRRRRAFGRDGNPENPTRGLYETVRDTLAHEHEEQWKLRATEDHQEGIRSVAERRPGNFKGR
jgi:enoyl-CoA hydratase/carnithine racemase